MQNTLVVKVRLYTNPTQSKQFCDLSKSYADACTYTSAIYHNSGSNMGQVALHSKVYKHIRRYYGLKVKKPIQSQGLSKLDINRLTLNYLETFINIRIRILVSGIAYIKQLKIYGIQSTLDGRRPT